MLRASGFTPSIQASPIENPFAVVPSTPMGSLGAPISVQDWWTLPENLMDGVVPSVFADSIGRYVLSGNEVRPDAIWALSAASGKSYTPSGGGIAFAGANEIRIDHSNGVPEIVFEGGGTCFIRNPRMEGSINGVMGSGGVIATNYSVSSTRGLTTEVVGNGVTAGVPWVRLRVFGTTTSSGAYEVALENTPNVPASVGQNWAISTYCRLHAGSKTNINNFGLGRAEFNSSIAYLTGGGVYATGNILTSLSSDLIRYGIIAPVTNASTAFIRPLLSFGVNSGVAIDITFDFGLCQAEQNNIVTSVMLPPVGAPAAAIRTADIVPLTTAARNILLASAGAAVWRGICPIRNATIFIDKGAARMLGPTSTSTNVQTGGATTLTANSAAGDWSSPAGACLSWGASGRRIAMNGGTVAEDANLILGGSTIHLGNSTGIPAGQVLRLRQFAAWPLADRASAAAVQAQARAT